MRYPILVTWLVGCLWSPAPDSRPDAEVRVIDASSDACVFDGTSEACCQYLPDIGEVNRCAVAQQAVACQAGGAPPGSPCYTACATLTCEQSDCSVVEVPYCAVQPRIDAGVTDATVRDSL